MIICECGEMIEGDVFKDYIKTSRGPSTPTVGHQKCGLIFDFVDGKVSKQYSSKKELKHLAMKFAEKKKMDCELLSRFMLNVDRLKSSGKLDDLEILMTAYMEIK